MSPCEALLPLPTAARDNDGFTDAFVTDYNTGLVRCFTHAP